MYKPTLDEAKALAEGYRCIPVSRKIMSDIATPIQVMKILKSVSRHCYMLESLEDSDRWGRYTFLGYDPELELTCVDGTVTISGATKIVKENPRPDAF